MPENLSKPSAWGLTEEESLNRLLHYYNKWYCQYYVYVFRVIDDPYSAKSIVIEIFLSLWKMRAEITSEEQLKSSLFKLADIHCSEHYKRKHQSNEITDDSWEKIWGKSKEFLHLEKEIAIIVGRLFEDGYFNPLSIQHYKDPTGGLAEL
ncbi:RNA polymerase sigma factor [Gynurincola endophyticus]|jgi:DNA-directed RNA polymerase specialized sigma24 family protein|uniref:hypothetical protein n=1 Tax=Gynurincola endophyticus TaxID=2479004 RepID=UPI000F8E219C|nr:hypothetical protein [Gynurincola endophyticus]